MNLRPRSVLVLTFLTFITIGLTMSLFGVPGVYINLWALAMSIALILLAGWSFYYYINHESGYTKVYYLILAALDFIAFLYILSGVAYALIG